MDKLKGVLQSRKFWAAVMGLVVVVVKGFRPDFPLSEEQLSLVVVVLVAYITGTALDGNLTPRPSRAPLGVAEVTGKGAGQGVEKP